MLVSFLIVDFFVPQAMSEDVLLAVLLGICIGQLNLIATWAAFAPGNVVVRLPWSLLLTILTWYSLVLGNRFESPSFRTGDATFLGLTLLCGVIVAQVPLWGAAHLFGWKLVNWGVNENNVGSQFNLRHILLGTVFVSIALALGRLVLPPGDKLEMHFENNMPLIIVVVALINLVVTVPCIWGAFLQAWMIIPLAFGWVFYCAIFTGIEFCVIVLVAEGPPENYEPLFYIYLMNLTQCATVFGTLLVLRGLGFRLLRTKQFAHDFRPQSQNGAKPTNAQTDALGDAG